MSNKYTREELQNMSEEEFNKAMQEMREAAEAKGRENLKKQIAREKRLLRAIDTLWDLYKEKGDGSLKPYLKGELERAVKASEDKGDEKTL